MALASLCGAAVRGGDGGQSLIAFIVDHQLRPDSGREARIVKANLEEIGMVVAYHLARIHAPSMVSSHGVVRLRD